MATVATIRTRIMDALDRDDLATYVPTWMESAHRAPQRLYNFDCMKKTWRALALSVSYNFQLPDDLKEPRFLCRVAGINFNSPIVPSAGNTLQTPFYEKTDFEEIVALRASLRAENRESDQTIRRKYAIENGYAELVPMNTLNDDQFVFCYYGFLSLPGEAASDWFTDNAFDYILYRSLLEAAPFLGEVDDRVPVWQAMFAKAETQIIGHAISIQYGGESLVMRG